MKFLNLLFVLICFVSTARAQTIVPPYDLWTPARIAAIRDQSTLNARVYDGNSLAAIPFTAIAR